MPGRRVCVVLTTRGNFAKMRSTIDVLRRDDRAELSIVVGGAILLQGYGDVAQAIARAGLAIDRRVHYILQGTEPITIARSAAIATDSFARVLDEIAPDVVVLVGDRFETLAIALAATCLGIPIAHVEGGEVSGSIDESIRHAITKLSHLHLAATADAAERIRRLGEAPETVHVVGTPTLDIIADADLNDRSLLADSLAPEAAAVVLTADQRYVVVLQHPVATEPDGTYAHAAETVRALRTLAMPAVWVVPNHEAHADEISRAIQEDESLPRQIFLTRSLPIEAYAALLKHSSCLIGNSSSGVRESEFLGVPVVNVGTRQTGRERGENVIDVAADQREIVAAVRHQLDHGPYSSGNIYGDGHSGERIAELLVASPLSLQKRIIY